jgi:hypothetical protein
MKSMENSRENVGEIVVGYELSQLTLNGETPHLPLYSKCFSYDGNQDNPNNCFCPIHGGCFYATNVNIYGMRNISPQIKNLPINEKTQAFIDRQDNNRCLLSFSEKLDIDLEDIIDKKISKGLSDLHMFKFIIILLIQSIMGLKAMYNAGYIHSDLHHKNILIKKNMYEAFTPYIQYIYDTTSYNNEQGQNIQFNTSKFTLTHGNVLAVLWDFGFVTRRGVNPSRLSFDDMEFMKAIFGTDAIQIFNDTGERYYQKWSIGALYDITRLIQSLKSQLIYHNQEYPSSFQVFNELSNVLVKCLNKQAEFYGGANLGKFSDGDFFPHDVDPLVILRFIINKLKENLITNHIISSIIKINDEQSIVYSAISPVDINSVAKIYPANIYNTYIQLGKATGIPDAFIFGFKSKRKSTGSNKRKSTGSNKRKSTRSTKRKSTRSNKRKSTRSNKRKSTRSNKRKSTRSTKRKSTRSTKRKSTRSTKRKSTRSNKRKSTRSNKRK